MTHRKEDQALTVRPPADAVEPAQQVLAERSLEMRGFIAACLYAVAADPDAFIGGIAEFWPPPKKRGRPPKAAEQAERPTPIEDRAQDGSSS